MQHSKPFSRPMDALSRDASVIGLRADLARLPSRDLLDQYAALAMLPEPLRSMSVARLTLIRDILLDRLDVPA